MSDGRAGAEYYRDKTDSLCSLFGVEKAVMVGDGIELDGTYLPVINDVIVALDASRLPRRLRETLPGPGAGAARGPDARAAAVHYAPDVQEGFGEEWLTHPHMLAEHEAEFRQYFDLVPLDGLQGKRLCDLGCGIGRWSYFLADRCQELVLVDFSEAIFVARENLRQHANTIFVMADVVDLPFGDDAFDLVYCLGVLHHLPVPALDALRGLGRLAPLHLVYLYYALDNRPAYFRLILRLVTMVRRRLSSVRSARARSAITMLLAAGVYAPLSGLGRALDLVGFRHVVPLAETYAGKSVTRMRQDVYDRFFTRIEQRFTRQEILALTDSFQSVRVSEELPYWHFLCER